MESKKYQLIQAYKNNNFNEYLRLIDECLDKGYWFEYDTIFSYAKVLRKMRKFDQAYKILKSLEKQVNDYKIAEDLCREYIHCYKPMDAYRLYQLKKKEFKNHYLIIKIYMLQGKIEEAKYLIEYLKDNGLIDENDEIIRNYQLYINNYFKHHSFIETEYSSFINNGDKLKEGYVVYLKDSPVCLLSNYNDNMANRRPYLIWKIEDNKVYMFPMNTKCGRKDYILSKDKYHNSFQDRTIKDSICITDLDNILTVNDKLYDEDYRLIIDRAFKTLYFGDQLQLDESLEFMKYFVGDINKYDIIEVIDALTREIKFYLVIDNENDIFKCLKVSINENKIIDYNIKIFNGYKGIFDVIKIYDYERDNYINQMKENGFKLDPEKVISKKSIN